MKNYYLKTAILLLLLLGTAATAGAYDFVVNGIWYNYLVQSERTVSVTHANGYGYYTGSVTIPSTVTYNGTTYDVVMIGEKAFYDCIELSSVTLPNSIHDIGTSAFEGCSRLTSITIPSNVANIYASAFKNCTNLYYVTLNTSTLTCVEQHTFDGCRSLVSIKLPNSVSYIGDYAFYNCAQLKTVEIGTDIRCNTSTINNYAFAGCTALGASDRSGKITCMAKYPPTVRDNTFGENESGVDYYEYRPIESNAQLYIPYSSKDAYNSKDHWKKFSKYQRWEFYSYPYYYIVTGTNTAQITHAGTHVDAPVYTYGGLGSTISLPTSTTFNNKTYTVNGIYGAFYGCTNLKKVTIPDTYTYIGLSSFEGCTGLTQINIPEGVSYIGYNAFKNSGLTNVVIPSTVTEVGLGAFATTTGTSPIQTVTCLATTPPYVYQEVNKTGQLNSWSGYNVFNNETYTSAPLYVPRGCKSAYQAAYDWSNFSTVYEIAYDFEVDGIYYRITSQNTVEVISRTDYNGNDNDSYEGEVVIPERVTHNGVTYTVTAIGNNAFRMCKGLTSISMPNTIRTIGSYAFHYCEGLTEVVIPNSVTTIKNNAFWLCLNLREAVIPNSVTTVGSMAFRNCTEMTRVVIGKNVTSIGSTSFVYCPNITEVTCLAEVPPTLTESGSNTTFAAEAYQNAVLRVPFASYDAYYNNVNWGRFNTIVSKQDVGLVTAGDVNGDGNVSISDVTALIDLLLSGGAIDNPAADVNGDSNVSISDVTALIDQVLSGTGGGGSTASGPARREFVINNYHFNMIKVDGGTFMMGLEGDAQATPVHQVTLSDYHIGETEVTQALWTMVMGSNPSNHQGDGGLPVENMSWYDCQEFVAKLNAMYEERFSLPTEAQWEFAARGGNKSQGYVYSGSNSLGAVAWYSGNSDGSTHLVATLAANELGLYDMSGNVFEWCMDNWGAYTSVAQVDPQGPLTGEGKVCRSSAYNRANNNNWFRCGGRTYDSPTVAAKDTGLRLAIQP